MDVNVHVLLPPVDRANGEMHGVERIDNVVHREFTFVVESRAIGVLMQFVVELTQRQMGRIRHRNFIVLINVRAGQRFDVVAEDVLNVSNGIGVFLRTVVVEVTHQSGAVAIPVAVGHRSPEFGSFTIAKWLAIPYHVDLQFPGRTIEVDADGSVVVLIGVFSVS